MDETGLRPPGHRLPRRAVAYWAARALVAGLAIGGVLAVAYALAEPARPWLGPALAAVTAWTALYAAIVPAWRHTVHRWEATPAAVYVRTGWFVREWRVAPLSRVQTVDTVRGPLHRLFRLATLTVTTASAQGPVTLDALDTAVASATARELTGAVAASRGDAT